MDNLNWREVLNHNIRSEDTYSVVIFNLDDLIQPEFIQNRVYLIDPKNGNPKVSSQGYPFGRYANSENFMSKDGIIDHPTLQFSTPKKIFDDFTEQQKDVTNMLMTFCNKRPTCFFWHNGTPDDNCMFNGLHIHLIVQNPYPIYMQHTYKVMKKVMHKYGIQVKCQKIKHLEALMNHLQKESRILLGSNNLGFSARLKKT